jgi:small neutral amino acid transporter SnatA (MarC family)
MDTQAFVDSFLLMFVLLNPFLLSIYLLDLIEELDGATFRRALVRGMLISFVVFAAFAWAGDAIFSRVLQVRFAAFLMFGGLVFLLIAIRYVMVGSAAIRELRGSAEHVSGSIAMPFLIGPGTVSASVLAGSHQPAAFAVLSIAVALTAAIIAVLIIKYVHDFVRQRHEPLVERYVDVVGRISALIIGTIAVDMILRGIDIWLAESNRPM